MTTWISQGPDSIIGGANVRVEGKTQAGALAAVVAHPTDPNILWVSSVNGGIWKTTNATAANPTWSTTTDAMPSLSINALDIDPDNPNNLIAGVGTRSSLGRIGGKLSGLLRTTDGGTTWTPLGQTGTANLQGHLFSGVAVRGSTIVAVSREKFVDGRNFFGELLRSTDNGETFSRVNVADRTERLYTELVVDPTNPNRLYAAAIKEGAGVFVSNDGGATWQATATLEELTASSANARIAVGKSGEIYVGVVNEGLEVVYRSADQGANWASMGVPTTQEGDNLVGIHPGGQGGLHFSIAADPTNANVVYVGGDAQPRINNSFPNSIGALSFSGRLFRGEFGTTKTWTPITDNFADPDGENGPIDGTGPHADSRNMTFSANGTLIEVDDGGIYQRTAPTQDTGIWTSLMGTTGISSGLRITEVHSVDWDSKTKRILAGAQDNGVLAGRANANQPWDELRGGDGGRVAIDDISGENSLWYFSSQRLGGFQYREVTPTGHINKAVFANLKVRNGSNGQVLKDYEGVEQPFYTPIKLNEVRPDWQIVVGTKGVYESKGEDTETQFSNTRNFNFTDLTDKRLITNVTGGAIAYGGRSEGQDNPYVLYVGTEVNRQTGALYLRTEENGRLSKVNAFPDTTKPIRDIALDPKDWHKAYVLNSNKIYSTTDAGETWTDITGNLLAEGNLGADSLRSVEYIPGGKDGLIVSGLGGVFSLEAPQTVDQNLTWTRLGTGLPNVVVYDLNYDTTDDLLTVGTLGRGIWTIPQVRSIFGGTMSEAPTAPSFGGMPSMAVSNAGASENIASQEEPGEPDEEEPQETIQIDEDEIPPTLTFIVSLDQPSTDPVTVTVNTRDGTAIAGQDYVPIVNQLVTFAPGELEQEVKVEFVNDNTSEGNDTLFLDLSNSTNINVIDAEGLGEIFDDDQVLADPTLNYDTPTGVFTIDGDQSQSVTGTFTLNQSAASFRNEVGFFVVDEQNRVTDPITGNLLAPNDAGYVQAGLNGSNVIFSALPDAGVLGFSNLSNQVELLGGDRLVFYLIPNDTADAVLNSTLSTDSVLLGATFGEGSFRNLRVTDQGNQQFTLAWEEQPNGGDQDFDDLILNFKIGNESIQPEAIWQGVTEAELIDLTGVDFNNDQKPDTQVTSSFLVNSEAAYDNITGFYVVDDEFGSIDTLDPSDAGYAQAAMQRRVAELGRNGSAPINLTGDALGLLAPFVIANGTVEQFLAQNPTNMGNASVVAYFPYIGANPDRVDHIRLLGTNTFGFEDLFGGGDKDYNDIVMRVDFQGF